MDIMELIGQETARYQEAAQRASRLGHYDAAAQAHASFGTLLVLQQKIKEAGISATVPPVRSTGAKATKGNPRITKPKSWIGSHKQWSLDDTLGPRDIDRIVGKDKREESDPYKVKFQWSFLVDGKECSIWDYKGARWSGYGPREAFEAIGIRILD